MHSMTSDATPRPWRRSKPPLRSGCRCIAAARTECAKGRLKTSTAARISTTGRPERAVKTRCRPEDKLYRAACRKQPTRADLRQTEQKAEPLTRIAKARRRSKYVHRDAALAARHSIPHPPDPSLRLLRTDTLQ